MLMKKSIFSLFSQLPAYFLFHSLLCDTLFLPFLFFVSSFPPSFPSFLSYYLSLFVPFSFLYLFFFLPSYHCSLPFLSFSASFLSPFSPLSLFLSLFSLLYPSFLIFKGHFVSSVTSHHLVTMAPATYLFLVTLCCVCF